MKFNHPKESNRIYGDRPHGIYGDRPHETLAIQSNPRGQTPRNPCKITLSR